MKEGKAIDLGFRVIVTLGSRFGDWQVCWLGEWAKHRLFPEGGFLFDHSLGRFPAVTIPGRVTICRYQRGTRWHSRFGHLAETSVLLML